MEGDPPSAARTSAAPTCQSGSPAPLETRCAKEGNRLLRPGSRPARATPQENENAARGAEGSERGGASPGENEGCDTFPKTPPPSTANRFAVSISACLKAPCTPPPTEFKAKTRQSALPNPAPALLPGADRSLSPLEYGLRAVPAAWREPWHTAGARLPKPPSSAVRSFPFG